MGMRKLVKQNIYNKKKLFLLVMSFAVKQVLNSWPRSPFILTAMGLL